MPPLDIILSFIISMAAGNIPTIKDLVSKNESIEKALQRCFNDAIEKWDVIEEIKQNHRDKYKQFLSKLKEYITHSPQGRHPQINELLTLWANEINNDPTASSFVRQIQQDLDLSISQDIKNIVNSINHNQQKIQAEIQTIKDLVDPFRGDGIKTIDEYWYYWATGNNFILHSDLVLAEREDKVSEIIKSAFIPGVYSVSAASISEAMAFVCASLLLSDEDSFKNAYVITKESTYEKIMATNPSGLIIITDLNANHNVAAHKGNIIFHCDLKRGNRLPELSPTTFTKSLEKSLSKNVKAYHLARQGGYDVVSLRRILQIEHTKPNWLTPQNMGIITDMCLLGGWRETCSGDIEIIENFTNQKYDDFIAQISPLLKVDNAPIIKIGTEWKIKSPIDLFSLILDQITDQRIEKLREQIPYLSVDTDPEVIDKLEDSGFRFYTNTQMISTSLKRGIYRNLAILSNIFEHEDLSKTEMIKSIIADELSTYDLKQYLSNRHYIIYFAAVNPKAFLDFIIKDIQTGGILLDALFKGRETNLSLNGYDNSSLKKYS